MDATAKKELATNLLLNSQNYDNAIGAKMIFETLYESSLKGELLLIDGGFCHWHLRKDKQLTIREIISTKPGSGKKMLDYLKKQPAISIFAKCPAKLKSNKWYRKNGFILESTEVTKSGTRLNCWRLPL